MTKLAKRIGIVAGNGILPVTIAQKLTENGDHPVVIGIEGEADPNSYPAQGIWLPLEKIAFALPLFKSRGVTHVVFAGGVRRRPNPASLRVPLALWPEIPGAVMALKRGDDGLLSALVKMFERHGLSVMGAHEILPDHVVPLGTVVGQAPAGEFNETIRAGVHAAMIIGEHDIGQAVVAMGRRVIAVEGIEGTDQMLQRIKALRGDLRISDRAMLALVKLAKPKQELRADMPVIGPATIKGCLDCGIKLICVSAGSTMMLDAAETSRLAKTAGISIIGIDPLEWVGPAK